MRGQLPDREVEFCAALKFGPQKTLFREGRTDFHELGVLYRNHSWPQRSDHFIFRIRGSFVVRPERHLVADGRNNYSPADAIVA